MLEPDPEDPLAEFRGFVNHRDHRRTGEMAIDAVYPTARDRLNFPEHLEEGLETHNVAEMYIWGNRGVNVEVDVSDVLETKIRALTRHVSAVRRPRRGLPAERARSLALARRPLLRALRAGLDAVLTAQ